MKSFYRTLDRGMRAMSARGRALGGALVGAVVATFAGCSEDWSIGGGGPASDAGSDAPLVHDGGVLDAADAALASDAVAGDTSSPPPQDSAPPPADGSSCGALAQALANARAAAVTCSEMDVNACKMSVTDECGCTVDLGGNSANATSFETAITEYKNAGCHVLSCSGSCPTYTGVCLAVDGGASYACYATP